MGLVYSRWADTSGAKERASHMNESLLRFLADGGKGLTASELDSTVDLLSSALRAAITARERELSRRCNVCLSNDISTVLKPCAHAVMCQRCSQRVEECPICRMHITKREKLIWG